MKTTAASCRVSSVASAVLLIGVACGSSRDSDSVSPPTVPKPTLVIAKTETIAVPQRFHVNDIEDYVGTTLASRHVVGASLVMIREGVVVSNRSFGFASLSSGAKVTDSTSFAIGSLTKQFTCALALQLASEKKLYFSDRVSKYFPTLTQSGEINIDDLVSHRSGYTDYYPLDYVDRRMQTAVSTDEILSRYASTRLDFSPGTHFSYSNTGYVLLGRIIEKAARMPFAELLKTRILRKLEMQNAHFPPSKGTGGLATGYQSILLGTPEPSPPEAADWLYSAGGLWASAADLTRWNLALLQGKLLDADSFRQLMTPRLLKNGRSTGYSCGFGVENMSGETALVHFGSVSGFVTVNALIPRTRSAVILLTNADYADIIDLQRNIMNLMVGNQHEAPTIAGPSATVAVRELCDQLRNGSLDRTKLTTECSEYFSPDRLSQIRMKLDALGAIQSVSVDSVAERGAMEMTSLSIQFSSRTVQARLFRTKDGKVAEFMLLHH